MSNIRLVAALRRFASFFQTLVRKFAPKLLMEYIIKFFMELSFNSEFKIAVVSSLLKCWKYLGQHFPVEQLLKLIVDLFR